LPLPPRPSRESIPPRPPRGEDNDDHDNYVPDQQSSVKSLARTLSKSGMQIFARGMR
jgi:hypothetical protein